MEDSFWFFVWSLAITMLFFVPWVDFVITAFRVGAERSFFNRFVKANAVKALGYSLAVGTVGVIGVLVWGKIPAEGVGFAVIIFVILAEALSVLAIDFISTLLSAMAGRAYSGLGKRSA